MNWDVFGYYLYLPAQFIYHDIKLEKKEEWLTPILTKYNPTNSFYQAYKGPKGIYVMKYSMGLSIIYSPFFFVADFLAPKLGYARDGFSPPYQYLLMIGSLVVSLLGLWFMFLILERYFSSAISFLVIALITFGTNYYVMTTYDGLMPHNFVFTFYAIMLYYTIKWYEVQKVKYILIAGICLGLATLTRPTTVVGVLIPILWQVDSYKLLITRLKLFIQHYKQVLIFGLAAFCILLPQLIYWKYITDQWLFYSYPDEKLDFTKPHILNVLFSFRKGWLIYTPLMAFAIIGFIALYRKQKQLFFSIIIYFVINTYIISCWNCWWYGGSFAERPFVESYVFMAFPLAAFFSSTLIKRKLILFFVTPFLLFFVYLNLFQTNQSLVGVLVPDRTTVEYYWRVFLKNDFTNEDRRWLLPLEYSDGIDIVPSEMKPKQVYSTTFPLTNKNSILKVDNVVNPTIFLLKTLAYHTCDHYILASALIDTTETENTKQVDGHLVVSILDKEEIYKYRATDFNFANAKSNGGLVKLSVLVPPQVSKSTYVIKVYCYVSNNCTIKLKELKADVVN